MLLHPVPNVRVIERDGERVRGARLRLCVVLPRCGANGSVQLSSDARPGLPRTAHQWPRPTRRICEHLLFDIGREQHLRLPEIGFDEDGPMLAQHGELPRPLGVPHHSPASRVALHYGRLVEGLALVGCVSLEQKLVASLCRHVVVHCCRLPTLLLPPSNYLCVPPLPLGVPPGRPADQVAPIAPVAQRRAHFPSGACAILDA
mmetsp:Transcript_98456/g.301182  ORF Transcript_98456/g.301182 Transcript_98456/m.301182 type:complete len:203 (-) Transcript_98456:568-1176(-)